MRTSAQKINPALKRQIGKTLAQTLTDIKKINDMEVFLSDFLTDAENEVFAKRLAIAYWVKKGRSYNNIKRNLKVSSATIAATIPLMETAGYRLALKIIEAEEWANQWAEKIGKARGGIKKFVGK
jgi:uncharacterized protein YerC